MAAPQLMEAHAQNLFPQLIDPQLDYLTFMLLRHLKTGTYTHAGLRMARVLLGDRTKPLLLVVCTNSYGPVIAEELERLRELATAAGVPVVHALSRRDLGEACGVTHCLTVASVMGTPDQRAQGLLGAVMDRASAAYGGYIALMASVSEPLTALDVAAEPFHLPAAPSLSRFALTPSLASLVSYL